MDVSKLPKLSSTPPPPQQPSPNPSPPPADPPFSVGGEAFISIAIGAILLLMNLRLLGWIFGRSVNATFTNELGDPISYNQSVFFWLDLGPTLFGLSLIIDGICLIIGRPWSMWLGLLATAASVAANLAVSIWLFRYNPYISMFAVALGVYAAIYQWKVLQLLSRHRPAPMT